MKKLKEFNIARIVFNALIVVSVIIALTAGLKIG